VRHIALLFFWGYRGKPARSSTGIGPNASFLVRRLVSWSAVAIEFCAKWEPAAAPDHDAIANGCGIHGRRSRVVAVLLNWRYRWDQGWLSVLAVRWPIVTSIRTRESGESVWISSRSKRAFQLIASSRAQMELTRWYFDHCHWRTTDKSPLTGIIAMRFSSSEHRIPPPTLIERLGLSTCDPRTSTYAGTSYSAEMEMIRQADR